MYCAITEKADILSELIAVFEKKCISILFVKLFKNKWTDSDHSNDKEMFSIIISSINCLFCNFVTRTLSGKIETKSAVLGPQCYIGKHSAILDWFRT